jgi:hypothetical protein
MDERVSQFLLSVGKLCADARIGRLTVHLTVAGGERIAGVPEPPPTTEGDDELDAIGFADVVTVDGVRVALSDVVEASVMRPDRGPDDR